MAAGTLILACWIALILYWNISARSVKPAADQQDTESRLARIPVWLAFLLFIVAWVHPFGPVVIRSGIVSGYAGVLICALGTVVSVWSRKVLGAEWSREVELKQGHKLIKTGPYSFVRHPIYTGHLLMGLGTAIASGTLIAFLGLVLLAIGLWTKLSQEERLLLRGFPDDYPAYQARVKAIVPYLF